MRWNLSVSRLLANHHCVSAVDAGVKWRPVSSELAELGPEFKKVWDSHFANASDKPVMWMGLLSACVIRLAPRERRHS